MNYYIADTHFGHENVLKFDNRPFENVNEMDKVMIEQWNAVVGKNDDVYIIGDFCYRAKKGALWYLKQLNGRKHLIQGNHDEYLLSDEAVMKEFVSVDKMRYVKDGSYSIVLCHFPIAEWNRYYRNSWHIYGHIHNKKTGCYKFLENEERALNAGCMINYYTPVTIEKLIANNNVFKENRDYLWKVYGEEKGPLQLEDGTWIVPSKIQGEEQAFMEEGDIQYIFSEYCKKGLIYHFYLNGIRDHEHSFEAVLQAAYESRGNFVIRDEDKQEYSLQELQFLEALLEKMKQDRKE